MASSHSSKEQHGFGRITSFDVPSEWADYVRIALTVGSFVALMVAFGASAAMLVVTLAPMAASVAGLAGILVVWLTGIGLVASTPRLALYCTLAVREAM